MLILSNPELYHQLYNSRILHCSFSESLISSYLTHNHMEGQPFGSYLRVDSRIRMLSKPTFKWESIYHSVCFSITNIYPASDHPYIIISINIQHNTNFLFSTWKLLQTDLIKNYTSWLPIVISFGGNVHLCLRKLQSKFHQIPTAGSSGKWRSLRLCFQWRKSDQSRFST